MFTQYNNMVGLYVKIVAIKIHAFSWTWRLDDVFLIKFHKTLSCQYMFISMQKNFVGIAMFHMRIVGSLLSIRKKLLFWVYECGCNKVAQFSYLTYYFVSGFVYSTSNVAVNGVFCVLYFSLTIVRSRF